MTDSQKLDLILEKMGCFEGKVDSLEGKVDSLEIRMGSLEGEVSDLKDQMIQSTTELKAMDGMMLDEVERVHRILDKHKADKTAHIA